MAHSGRSVISIGLTSVAILALSGCVNTTGGKPEPAGRAATTSPSDAAAATVASTHLPTPSTTESTRLRPSPTSNQPPISVPSPTANPGPPVDGQVLDKIDEAIAAVSGSWQESFPNWSMPTFYNGNGLYDSTGRAIWTDPWRDGPSCGGDPAAALNAIYCRVNDTVSWDLAIIEQNLGSTGLQFIDVVVAHEVAHAAQQRLRRGGQGLLVWQQEEMQADCIAGSLLADANVAGRIEVDMDDLDRMYATLVAVADAEPWRGVGDHGDAAQRMLAFDEGAASLDLCIGPPGPPTYAATPSPVRTSLITPSGNIRCADTGAMLKCTIKEFDFPSECGDGGMPLITMDVIDPPTAQSCAGQSLEGFDPQPVEYGEVVEVGLFSCSAESTGLNCENSEGHGFDLSRAQMRLY
jgi:hypothetical protein